MAQVFQADVFQADVFQTTPPSTDPIGVFQFNVFQRDVFQVYSAATTLARVGSYLPPPPDAGSATLQALYRHTRQIAAAARLAMQGKVNATGIVTLAPNTTSTTLTDPRLTIASFLSFDPATATAAAELAGGTLYASIGGRGNGAWVLTHSNSSATDRTFRYLIVGAAAASRPTLETNESDYVVDYFAEDYV